MQWIGWVIAGLALLVIFALVWRQRRAVLTIVEERALMERRSRSDAESIRKQAEESAAHLRADAERIIEQAQQRSKERSDDLERRREEMEISISTQRQELREKRAGLESQEARLHEREDRVAVDLEGIQMRLERLRSQKQQLRDARRDVELEKEKVAAELERLAGLSMEDARQQVLDEAEHQARLSAKTLQRDIEQTARRDAEKVARSIIVSAIQRCASEQTSESVVSSIDLPSDDMKGRIIGREGRNIRAFEQITGVNVLIDETPETVLLSCFDPVRRETARLALTELVADGRIHPARIEEVFDRSRGRIAERCLRAAEEALLEVGISDLHPDLMPVLGSLRYRTSYGQNVLKHLVECAHLAGVIAAELHLDVETCKRAAFLHDIGKALTHEVEGTHAIIGADLARRHGEHPDIVHAIEAHHNEVEPRTVEAILTQACDAISGGRPGARRESLESYVQRLERLEEIAGTHPGVEKVFAMQAGREVRVMVSPEHVDDIEAQILARDIVKQIEEELTYPGNIRVTVVRESRATELAR